MRRIVYAISTTVNTQGSGRKFPMWRESLHLKEMR
jgi:hypothetical protein